MLQLGTSGIAVEGRPFGRAPTLPIAMTNVECTGEEEAIQQCVHRKDAALAGCTHEEDVSIECGDALPEGEYASH